jgi:hypothetical protein
MLQHFFFDIPSTFLVIFHRHFTKCSNIFWINIFLKASSNIFKKCPTFLRYVDFANYFFNIS